MLTLLLAAMDQTIVGTAMPRVVAAWTASTAIRG